MPSIKEKFISRFEDFADTECGGQMGSSQTGAYGLDPAMTEGAYERLLDEIDEFILKNYSQAKPQEDL